MNKSRIVSDIFTIQNITCYQCSEKIKKALIDIEGIYKVRVNLFLKQSKICYDANLIDYNKIISILKSYGFKCEKYEYKWSGLFYINLCVFILQNFVNILYYNLLTNFILSFIPVLLVILKVNNKKLLSSDSFILNGAFASYILAMFSLWDYNNAKETTSLLDTATTIILFVFLGKFLQETIQIKNTKILKLIQNNNFIKGKNTFTNTSNKSEINIGDILLIEEGSYIPADGIVYKGSTYINEANLTGECNLIYKKQGSFIYAGTQNISKSFYLKVENLAKDSFISRIHKFIEENSFNFIYESKIFSNFTRNIKYFSFVIFNINIVIRLLKKESFILFNSFKAALSVVIIACPCAFSIAIPMAFLIFNYDSLRKNILIKDINPLLKNVNYIFFDKTGTLTEGKFTVSEYKIFYNDKSLILQLIRTIEKEEDHPIGRALFFFSNELVINDKQIPVALHKKHYFSSLGIEAILEVNKNIYHIKIGTDIFVTKTKKDSNKTYVSLNNILVGYFVLSDKLREESIECINKLRSMNYYCAVITGDKKENAQKTCEKLNLNHIFFNASSEEKMKIINEYKKKGNVLMIGDGINDSAALSVSDIGISFSRFNTLANIVFLKEDLNLLVDLLIMKKKLTRKVNLNILLSCVYNFISIPFATGLFYKWNIHVSPNVSCYIMMISSLSVIINTLL